MGTGWARGPGKGGARGFGVRGDLGSVGLRDAGPGVAQPGAGAAGGGPR